MAYKLLTGIAALLIITGCTASQMTPDGDAKNTNLKRAHSNKSAKAVDTGKNTSQSTDEVIMDVLPENYQPKHHYSLPIEVTNAIRYLPCDTITQSAIDDTGDYDFVCSTDDEENVSYILSATEEGSVNQITLLWKEYPVEHMYDDRLTGKPLPFLSYIEKRFLNGYADMASMKSDIINQKNFRIPAHYFIVDYNYKIQNNNVDKYKLNTMTIYVR